jgi:hypothetical protein
MEITPKWKFVEGSFDTKDAKMICVSRTKYKDVYLSIIPKGTTCNFPVAEIKLHLVDTYEAAAGAFDEAEKLGKEIARRWNECETKK